MQSKAVKQKTDRGMKRNEKGDCVTGTERYHNRYKE